MVRPISAYSANKISRRLGAAAIIWIDPGKVRQNVENLRSRRPKLLGKYLESAGWIDGRMKSGLAGLFYRNQFVIEDRDFVVRGPVDEMQTSILAKDLAEKAPKFEESLFYRTYMDDLSSEGFARYKRNIFRSEAEVKHFFRTYLLPLLESLRTSGYELSRSPDRCKCYVAADGEIMQGENGRHRLAFARALEIPRFPFTVFGVHEEWYRRNVGERADLAKLRRRIRDLEAQYQR